MVLPAAVCPDIHGYSFLSSYPLTNHTRQLGHAQSDYLFLLRLGFAQG